MGRTAFTHLIYVSFGFAITVNSVNATENLTYEQAVDCSAYFFIAITHNNSNVSQEHGLELVYAFEHMNEKAKKIGDKTASQFEDDMVRVALPHVRKGEENASYLDNLKKEKEAFCLEAAKKK